MGTVDSKKERVQTVTLKSTTAMTLSDLRDLVAACEQFPDEVRPVFKVGANVYQPNEISVAYQVPITDESLSSSEVPTEPAS